MQQWRLLQTGDLPPGENMAIDEAVVIAHGEGLVKPTIRFYGWNPPSLSIGYFQKAEREVDFEALAANGIGFVRRPTGGRAVLHDQELTYSVIVSEAYEGLPSNITESYRYLSHGLMYGFRELGLDAEMVSCSVTDKQRKSADAASAACFDSPSWYELVVEGRKIAGSAQQRSRGVVLQHGSILLDLDIDLLFNVLRFGSEGARERLKKAFAQKAVAANDLLRAKGLEPIDTLDAAQAFQVGFSEALGIELVEEPLTAYEAELAAKLAEEKYNTPAWNMRFR